MLEDKWVVVYFEIIRILLRFSVNCSWLFQVRETVRDVVFLHNELFFAAAQKK